MKESLSFLATPMAASAILAAMLGYFGTHILARRIIFIDIAVAQIAALGTMIGLLLGYAEEAMQVQLFSYLLTMLVIGGFALLRTDRLPIPAEAVIGIIYCIGLAFSLLLAEYIPGGSNYITKTITGNILWVTWDQVISLGLLFAPVALIHLLLRNRFFHLSNDPHAVQSGTGTGTRFLNLLFYITFGVVVVKAVLIGGIFLVFTLLIAPSTAAALFVESWTKRVIWSCVIGVLGTIAGILLSYSVNISNGPAIVSILGLLAFVLAIVRSSGYFHQARRRSC
ncbi:MAG: metal ABC transporter permease [Bacteroidales bacterium]